MKSVRYKSAMLAATFVACATVVSGAAIAEGIFKYNGKTYGIADLSATHQQSLHDLQLESYLRMQGLAEQVALDLWIEDQMKEKKKSRAEIEAEAFKVSEPTQKDVSDWYEENKNRLPPGYKLEQISGDIKTLLESERRKKSREKVMEDLRKKGIFALLLPEPKAPVFQISTDGHQVRGSEKAGVTIVEFADYKCPHCKAAKDTIGKLLKKYNGKVRLVYIDFPVDQSGVSMDVAHGAYCAGKQKKYWEFHDLAFERQRTLDHDSSRVIAKELKLDEAKFNECMASEEPKAFVNKSKAEGERIGITGTPGIFINGKKVKGYGEKELIEEVENVLSGKSS